MAPFRVLVVDDNEDHRFLTKRAVRSLDPVLAIEVLTAGNGDEALAMLVDAKSEATPHLVLLDVKMPGTDGFEVLRRVRAHAATRELPVVMFSSSENLADQARATELGASGFVTKPIDARGFVEMVRAVVELWARRANA